MTDKFKIQREKISLVIPRYREKNKAYLRHKIRSLPVLDREAVFDRMVKYTYGNLNSFGDVLAMSRHLLL